MNRLLTTTTLLAVQASGLWAADNNVQIPVECPRQTEMIPPNARSATYADLPFKQGEEAKYELKYGALKVLVGYGWLRVESPLNHPIIVGPDKDAKPAKALESKEGSKGKEKTKEEKELEERLSWPGKIEPRWHMVFRSEAYTGDWYKMIFAAHDKIQAIVRPWDFGISRFYISQDEEKPFSRRYHREKWLEFDHFRCRVEEKEVDHTKNKTAVESFDLMRNAEDTLGAVYKLRTFDYVIGKRVRFPVYSSGKNWWLEADPIAFEKVKVNAGEFDTVKLKLHTFIGEELQQRGDVYVWIANKHPSKPMVKVEGDVSFGSVYLLLESFKPGR
jgi:hypothetical protein